MAKRAHEILADALEAASKVAIHNIVQSDLLEEKQVTLLKKEGFLKAIVRGWYLLDADLSSTDAGTSALWHESYWSFVGQYLNEYVGDDYVMSAEQSLDWHTGSNVLPLQLLIGNRKKINRVLELPRHLSLSLYTIRELPEPCDQREGINIYPLESALIKAGPIYFRRQPQEITLALQTADFPRLLRELLDGAKSVAAGRLAGAYRAVNMPDAAEAIRSAMDAAGLSVTESNPFETPVTDITLLRPQSPHATRVALRWASVSDRIAASLPDKQVPPPADIELAIERLEETYTHDAYHSLSIEGYSVTRELIEQVQTGAWNPQENAADQKHLDALAARGYWEAHNKVTAIIRRLHNRQITIEALQNEVSDWYRVLFGPMVRAGILRSVDLVGYRNRPVFIRGSRHTPLPKEAVPDAMETLFDCAQKESHPLTRAILGHWLIGYIHPFPDGNGRTARFLMNALLVAAGYPWTIIRLETRTRYMAALEALSVDDNPDEFVALILEAMSFEWS